MGDRIGPEWICEGIGSLEVADRWAVGRGLRLIESDEHIRLWVTTKMSRWLQTYLDPAHPEQWWNAKPCARVESEGKLCVYHWWWIPGVNEP